MNADARPGGTTTRARAPRGPRVAIVISALISFALIAVNIRASISGPNMINVEVPWLGLTEAGILLLAMWPAWRGRLWAVSAQTVVLIFVVFHSYWLLATTSWMSGRGGFVQGNSAVWATGVGEGYLVVMLPYFVVILSEAIFVIRQLHRRGSKAVVIAHTGDAGAVTPEGTISSDARPGGKSTPARAPVPVRVVVAITGLIAALMIGRVIGGPWIPWQGVPEAVVLLAVLWPAWKGQLWAVSVQGVILLLAVFHSYFYFYFYSQPNPISGLGGYYLVFLAPLFVLMLFDVIFVVRQLRIRRLPGGRAIAH